VSPPMPRAKGLDVCRRTRPWPRQPTQGLTGTCHRFTERRGGPDCPSEVEPHPRPSAGAKSNGPQRVRMPVDPAAAHTEALRHDGRVDQADADRSEPQQLYDSTRSRLDDGINGVGLSGHHPHTAVFAPQCPRRVAWARDRIALRPVGWCPAHAAPSVMNERCGRAWLGVGPAHVVASPDIPTDAQPWRVSANRGRGLSGRAAPLVAHPATAVAVGRRAEGRNG
jgi:hypothetical protein